MTAFFALAADSGPARMMPPMGDSKERQCTVRQAVARDVPEAAATLSRAFFDDPQFAWLLPHSASRQRRLRRLFAAIMRHEVLGHGVPEVAVRGGRIVGVAMWMPPGGWQVPLGRQLRSLPGTASALGRRLPAGSSMLATMARAHPRDELHWYLHGIGVEPYEQGTGIGSSLMRAGLARVDGAGMPAYLESSKPNNVPLYEHFGFTSTGEIPLSPQGPALVPMWRPPQALSLPTG